MKKYDIHDYQIIRTQFFASANKMSMSISPKGIRFSTACIRKFPETECIELKVHPFEPMLAVVPCNERHKNKMRWAMLRGDIVSIRAISAGAFLDTLYELFGWDKEKRYRLRGEILGNGNDKYALFDVSTPEIFTARYNFEIPWATSFGEDFYLYKNSRPENIETARTFSEYSNESDLRPSSQKTAKRNVKVLIEKMQRGSD